MPLLRISVGGCPSDAAALPSHRPAFSRVSACGLIRRVNRRTQGFRAAGNSLGCHWWELASRKGGRRLRAGLFRGGAGLGLRPPAGGIDYCVPCYGLRRCGFGWTVVILDGASLFVLADGRIHATIYHQANLYWSQFAIVAAFAFALAALWLIGTPPAFIVHRTRPPPSLPEPRSERRIQSAGKTTDNGTSSAALPSLHPPAE